MTFRERYNKWKAGELVYSAGRVLQGYEGGKDGDPVVLPEVTVRPAAGDQQLIERAKLLIPNDTLRYDLPTYNLQDGNVDFNRQFSNMLDLYEVSGKPNINIGALSPSQPKHGKFFYKLKSIGHSLGLNRDYTDDYHKDYNRSSYNTKTNTINLGTPSLFYSELAHAYQNNNDFLVGRNVPGDYVTQGTNEFNAHKAIEPTMNWYMANNKADHDKSSLNRSLMSNAQNRAKYFGSGNSVYSETYGDFESYLKLGEAKWNKDNVWYKDGKDIKKDEQSYSLGDITKKTHELSEISVTGGSKYKKLPVDSPYTIPNMLRTQMLDNLRNYLLTESGINDIINPFNYNQMVTPFKTSFDLQIPY